MIRPFQPGDIYLIQRLSRQAMLLPCARNFLQPTSSLSLALSTIAPWVTARATTYVLRQDGHGLVHEGFLQMLRRAGRPEAELLCLAPSLDAPTGHPAIWNKLLSHLSHEGSDFGVSRIYAEVPDQPLLVNTFAAVGFQPFCRQTIWRCFDLGAARRPLPAGFETRPRTAADDWALMRLYAATVPEPVQLAEGAIGEPDASAPVLENLRPDQGVTYVLWAAGEAAGAFQVQRGVHGAWLQLWCNTLQPDSPSLRLLLDQALAVVAEHRWPAPLYIAASDFHGGLERVLEETGFAPFRDRVRMVKHVVKRVRESVSSLLPVVEPTSEVVPTSFAPPSAVSAALQPSITTDSGSTA